MKGIKKMKGEKDEDANGIIPVELQRGFPEAYILNEM
jgi:hypothetical protein